jgi:hypothetical protein
VKPYTNQQTHHHTNGKPAYIQHGEGSVPYDVSPRSFKIVFDHDEKFLIT